MADMNHFPYGPYEQYVKRPLDFFLSLFALIVLSPLLVVISFLICIQMGRPVFFKQRRVGKKEKEFVMFKFRSMTDERDENDVYLSDEQRITKFGGFIRKTSIDELPSLFNVIRGDMAIIGPRPLPTRYLSRYTKEQRRRHEVRPGLSNPSTANGRNDQSWEQQFIGDVWYVDHISFFTDVNSIIETIKIVFNHNGVTAEDGGSRGEFIGIANVDDLKTDSEGSFMKL